MYSIGKFSKICDTPVKTLRYYSDIGLVEPSYIDPVTNYRYYDYDKIKLVKKIKLLKSCHFSLDQIKELVERGNQSQWAELLDEKIKELQSQKILIDRQIEEIQQIQYQIKNEATIFPAPLLSDCYLETKEELTVFSIKEKIKIQFIDLLVKKLFERVYAFNLDINGKLMAIFHDRDPKRNEADIELLIPIKDTNKIPECKKIESGIFACLTIQGPYSELELGYKKLSSWIGDQNLSPIGKWMEIYEKGLVPTDFDIRNIRPDINRPPDMFVTEICVQVNVKTD
jgi:DNA-binding transcriptional MerR regulator